MSQTTPSSPARAGVRGRRVYSIHMLLRGEDFAGQISIAGKNYDCRFRPLEGKIVAGRLRFTGSFSVIGTAARSRTIDAVEATLAAIQAGYGTPPKAPLDYELDTPAAIAAPVATTENTGDRGYAGVLYFHLSALDGRRLGVDYDLKKVQLNVRMAPVSDEERELHWLLSALATSLLDSGRKPGRASAYLDSINERLRT